MGVIQFLFLYKRNPQLPFCSFSSTIMSFFKVVLFIAIIGMVACDDAESKRPRPKKCPPNSVWQLGNKCTDSCNKEVMKCTAKMWEDCWCQGNFRRGSGCGPHCIPAAECPTGGVGPCSCPPGCCVCGSGCGNQTGPGILPAIATLEAPPTGSETETSEPILDDAPVDDAEDAVVE